jgi:hypothetical protein
MSQCPCDEATDRLAAVQRFALPGVLSRPLTVVSWETDYGFGFPLVDASAEARGRTRLDTERLGIPPDLGRRLAEWADRWEDLAMRHVHGESPTEWAAQAEQELARDEWTLLDELRRELPPEVELLVWGVPFDEWREQQRSPGR